MYLQRSYISQNKVEKKRITIYRNPKGTGQQQKITPLQFKMPSTVVKLQNIPHTIV